jgi:GNAT superfamily N-acetyltransferase
VEVEDFEAARTDGAPVRIRPVQQADRAAMHALNARVSDGSTYRRYFSGSRSVADDYTDSLLNPSIPAATDRIALVALIDDELVGVASYGRFNKTTAEFGVLIDDRCQHQGIGTVLIETLIRVARANGFTHLKADVLSENGPMFEVIRDLGYPTTQHREYGVASVRFALDPTAEVAAAHEFRQHSAEVGALDEHGASR